jgi:hypothetical protein
MSYLYSLITNNFIRSIMLLIITYLLDNRCNLACYHQDAPFHFYSLKMSYQEMSNNCLALSKPSIVEQLVHSLRYHLSIIQNNTYNCFNVELDFYF